MESCNIKISKQGKYYLTENGKRFTEDQSYIEKISDKYFAFKNFDSGKTIWNFYNITTKKIDLSINDSRLISTEFERNEFTFDEGEYFVVYNKTNLSEILRIKKNKDLYNFHYISDGYSIYEGNIYKQNNLLGSLNDFELIYNDESNNHCFRKVDGLAMFYLNKNNIGLNHQCFTFFKQPIPINLEKVILINKNNNNDCVFIFKLKSKYEIIYDNEILYNGLIDETEKNNTFNTANKNMIDFSDGKNKYVITYNRLINGPFEVFDFEFNRIFKNNEYTLFYKDNKIIKYNHQDFKISVTKSPLSFNLHLNSKTEVLFKNGNEYAKLRVGVDDYFFNEKSNDYQKLETAIEIIPYTYENKIYFLDENLNESFIEPKLDVHDLIISDYTYYNENIYVILRDESIEEPNGKYIVYDIKNNRELKTFDSFFEFTEHNGFYLNDIKYHASSFIWTLDEKAGKIVKLPFKTRGMYIRNERLMFKDMNNQRLWFEIDDTIYIKE
jgi:hypothetical protein